MEAAMTQRLEALELANRVRLDAVAVKRELRAGSLTIAEALEDERSQSLEVLSLLSAPWRMGEARARTVLRRAALHRASADEAVGTALLIPENKRVRHLTDFQKARIVRALSDEYR